MRMIMTYNTEGDYAKTVDHLKKRATSKQDITVL